MSAVEVFCNALIITLRDVDRHYYKEQPIVYKFILATLIDSEQMLLSIEAQLWSKRFALSTCAQLCFNVQQHLF